MSEGRTENDAVIDLTRTETREVAIGDEVGLVHEGGLLDISNLREAPIRTATHHRFTRLDSLTKYINGSTTENIVFLDRSKNGGSGAVTAVFDVVQPSFSEVRATMPIEESRELARWQEISGAWISQDSLINLLELSESDFVKPPSADLMTLASNLELHTKSQVVAKKNVSNGMASMAVFHDEDGDASTKIPHEITIGIPLIAGLRAEEGKALPLGFKVRVKVRMRVRDGKFQFMLWMVDLDERLDVAWEIIGDRLDRDLGHSEIYWAEPVFQPVC